jgi:hypothetical protein
MQCYCCKHTCTIRR